MCGQDVSGCAQNLSQATLGVTGGAVKEGRAGSRAQLLPNDLGYDLGYDLASLCCVPSVEGSLALLGLRGEWAGRKHQRSAGIGVAGTGLASA